MRWLVTAEDVYEIVCRRMGLSDLHSDGPEERVYIQKKIKALESLLSMLDAFYITTDI